MALAKANTFDAYKDMEILTANQGKLIVMLYEGAIRFLKLAADNMHHNTYDVVNTNIIKAQDILTELMLALNMEQGGDIASNLFNLYAFMKKQLLEANMKKDASNLHGVIRLLDQLKGAWEEVALKEAGRPEPVLAKRRAEGASFSITG